MLKIIHAKDTRVDEIEQTIPMLFSYAKFDGDTVTRKHTYVKCRDFLGDVIWSNKHKKPMEVYRFKVSHEDIPLEDTLQLIIKFPTTAIKENFINNYQHIVHSVEVQNDLRLTELVDASDLEIVVVADNFWQQTIQTVSLYTFLLKCCAYKYDDVGNWILEQRAFNSIESSYVKRIPKLQQLLENIKKVMLPFDNVTGFNDEEILGKYVLHDGCGFVNTFSFKNERNVYSTRFAELCA